jgi:hypothetical protein
MKAKKRSFETTKLKKIQIEPVTPLFELVNVYIIYQYLYELICFVISIKEV